MPKHLKRRLIYEFYVMAEKDITKSTRLWKDTKIKNYDFSNFSKQNRNLSIEFLKDFELGLNTPKRNKGPRTPGTLLKLRNFCVFLNRHFSEKNFNKITNTDLHDLFKKMSEGEIKKPDGNNYKDVGDIVKNAKTFFGWMKRTENISSDVTVDLSPPSYKKQKPAWVYFDHEQILQLNNYANAEYRPLMVFFYDSGLRPEEGFRIRVGDFKNNYSTLHVPKYREDGTQVSKTFERTIKLMHSSKLIENYVKRYHLNPDDLLIQKSQVAFNKYLKRLAFKLFGNMKTPARGYVRNIRVYDIRHWSSIYWLDKYKTNKDLMYRMGWNREDKVLYYSEFLGRRDKIDDEDMVTTEDKNRYEKEIEKLIKQQNRNIELLQKVSSVTQILLKLAMEDDKIKDFFKNQILEIFPEREVSNHL